MNNNRRCHATVIPRHSNFDAQFAIIPRRGCLANFGLCAAANRWPAGGNLTCVRGGLPIVWEGTVIGGIGISGGTETQDEELARAGLAALQ